MQDEKRLTEENSQLEARIRTLTSLKAACIAQLKSISTQKLCEGVSSLASLIPPGHEEALVAVRVVLYREIASQIKELAHIYNDPVNDQEVPEPNGEVVQKRDKSDLNSQVFALSRVTPSLFAIKEVNQNFDEKKQHIITCKVQEMPGSSSKSLPSEVTTTNKPLDDTVELLRRRIAEQRSIPSVGPIPGREMASAVSTHCTPVAYQKEVPGYITLPSHGQTDTKKVDPHRITTVTRQESKPAHVNPGSTETIPAQLILPMPILEQAAPIDLSKKKGKTRSEDSQRENTKKIKSSALPEIYNNANDSQCDELNLLATTALALDLTKRDSLQDLRHPTQSHNEAGADFNRPVSQDAEVSYEFEAEVANDYNLNEFGRRDKLSSDVEMIYSGDADDELSRETVLSPQSGPVDLSKPTEAKQTSQDQAPSWKNYSTDGPVVVWVQSISTGIGELPQNRDKQTRNEHSKFESSSQPRPQSSLQSGIQSRNESTFQPSIELKSSRQIQPTIPPTMQLIHRQQHGHHLPGSSRPDILPSNGTGVVGSSPDRHHPSVSTNPIPMDTISLSSSEDGEPSSSGYHPETSRTYQEEVAAGQLKLLSKNFTSPQKGSPLIGETRRERQRHASKKNRVKNQMMKRALAQVC